MMDRKHNIHFLATNGLRNNNLTGRWAFRPEQARINDSDVFSILYCSLYIVLEQLYDEVSIPLTLEAGLDYPRLYRDFVEWFQIMKRALSIWRSYAGRMGLYVRHVAVELKEPKGSGRIRMLHITDVSRKWCLLSVIISGRIYFLF